MFGKSRSNNLLLLRNIQELHTTRIRLHQEISDLRASMVAAMNELGIPSENYPAPVANAHRILHEALYGDL